MLKRSLLLGGCVLLALAAPATAQKEHRQPLTDVQVDKIREAGIDPDARIKLYAQFVGEHVETIKGLTPRIHSGARTKRMDDELQDLTALMDELGSNLDQYGERKADMRKSLKELTDAEQTVARCVERTPYRAGVRSVAQGGDRQRERSCRSGGADVEGADGVLRPAQGRAGPGPSRAEAAIRQFIVHSSQWSEAEGDARANVENRVPLGSPYFEGVLCREAQGPGVRMGT